MKKIRELSGDALQAFIGRDTFVAKYRVDPACDYTVYFYPDEITYEEKKKFIVENKLKTEGVRSTYVFTPNGLYLQVCFLPISEENLKPYIPPVYGKEKKLRDKELQKEEKKLWGNARVIESKNKILSIMIEDIPMNVETLAVNSKLSSATVSKIMVKMVDNGISIIAKKEGKTKYYMPKEIKK